ncbi:hypothetical protein AB0P32_00525 [Streptomyces sp. NPDC085995]|uniref:hypothetical protein n=1 Tax=Streptomyces sp. NPDC085995 TaxID=3154861 RepID=UPI00341256E5
MTFLQAVGRRCVAAMEFERSAARRPRRGGRPRSAGMGGAALFLLAAGTAATATATAASLLVESLLAKRVLWAVVLLAVSVSIGLWRGGHSVTASPPSSDRLPYAPRAGSPR